MVRLLGLVRSVSDGIGIWNKSRHVGSTSKVVPKKQRAHGRKRKGTLTSAPFLFLTSSEVATNGASARTWTQNRAVGGPRFIQLDYRRMRFIDGFLLHQRNYTKLSTTSQVYVCLPLLHWCSCLLQFALFCRKYHRNFVDFYPPLWYNVSNNIKG